MFSAVKNFSLFCPYVLKEVQFILYVPKYGRQVNTMKRYCITRWTLPVLGTVGTVRQARK